MGLCSWGRKVDVLKTVLNTGKNPNNAHIIACIIFFNFLLMSWTTEQIGSLPCCPQSVVFFDQNSLEYWLSLLAANIKEMPSRACACRFQFSLVRWNEMKFAWQLCHRIAWSQLRHVNKLYKFSKLQHLFADLLKKNTTARYWITVYNVGTTLYNTICCRTSLQELNIQLYSFISLFYLILIGTRSTDNFKNKNIWEKIKQVAKTLKYTVSQKKNVTLFIFVITWSNHIWSNRRTPCSKKSGTPSSYR